MILRKNRYLSLTVSLILIFFCSTKILRGQNNTISGLTETISERNTFKQDSLRNSNVISTEADTSFTYEKYAAFLTKISDTSKYIVLPLNEFRSTLNSNKVVIGLRHDVDIDLNLALQFSETESKLGFRSTYFILHTAPYYLANFPDMSVHSESIIPILKKMQDEGHFEIGWHNDLVTLQAVYNINPVTFLHNELSWLRGNGINIYGSASHGSNYCYVYKYLNYYFFEECTYPVVGQFINNLSLPIDGIMVPMNKGKLSDFNLEYEAYFINNNKYFSDATITNGVRWNTDMLNIDQLHAGDRVIILLHPVHWHQASLYADVESFHINGQKSSVIDPLNLKISVKMPFGTNRNVLLADFALSPGASAKVAGKLQISGSSYNSFINPLVYTVYAENRDFHKNWTIDVQNESNSASDFESFVIQGLTKSVNINSVEKKIIVEVIEGTDLSRLTPQFELSPGAKAWIGEVEQFSNSGIVNFSGSVQYHVLAEDGISSSIWTISVLDKLINAEDIESSQATLSAYPNPSDGIIHLVFRNIPIHPTRLDIFNSLGEKVFTELISKTGNFNFDVDFSKNPAGVYIVKYSYSEKPVTVIIKKN